MKEKIDELLKSGALAELHFYTNSDGKFSCGIVIACDDKSIAFQSYGPYGDYDGYHIEDLRDIIEIATDTTYLEALDIIIGDNRREPIRMESENVIRDFLLLSIEENKPVLLDINQSDGMKYAFVSSLSDSAVQVKPLTEYGEIDGSATINLNDIFALEYDSRDTRKIEKLFLAKK